MRYLSLLCLVAACGTPSYSRVDVAQQAVFVGMSAEQATSAMGPPDFAGPPRVWINGVTAGTRTIEWQWTISKGTERLVAWLDAGHVVALTIVPSPQAR